MDPGLFPGLSKEQKIKEEKMRNEKSFVWRAEIDSTSNGFKEIYKNLEFSKTFN